MSAVSCMAPGAGSNTQPFPGAPPKPVWKLLGWQVASRCAAPAPCVCLMGTRAGFLSVHPIQIQAAAPTPAHLPPSPQAPGGGGSRGLTAAPASPPAQFQGPPSSAKCGLAPGSRPGAGSAQQPPEHTPPAGSGRRSPAGAGPGDEAPSLPDVRSRAPFPGRGRDYIP